MFCLLQSSDPLKSAERFRVDNIADYIHETFVYEEGLMNFDLPQEIPNIAPLASTMWFEMYGDLEKQDHGMRSGCLVEVIHDAKKEGRDQHITEVRWTTVATIFALEENHFFTGHACQEIGIGFDGKPLTVQAVQNPFFSEREWGKAQQNDELLLGLYPCLVTALFAICFCHCKNITVETEKVSRQVQRAAERAKEPVLTLKTIDIHPVKKVLTEEGQVERQGIKRALHICRAHFAHYTEEHPLFGKYTGTFYKPMHVRGNIKEGMVIKDYTIHDK